MANIVDRAGRETAYVECLRVLRPGRRLALADYRLTAEYAATPLWLGAATRAQRALVRAGLGIVGTVSATKG